MSAASVKLSPALKNLIKAPHALGHAVPAPSQATATKLFDSIRSVGEAGGIGSETWLTTCAAALCTVNSPGGVVELFKYAAKRKDTVEDQVQAAAVIRETALKCISFNGIPRTINALNEFRAHLPDNIMQGLSSTSTRSPSEKNIEEMKSRGRGLWDAIYQPHHVKLLDKLGEAHPDLPVHILNSHYSALLSDPFAIAPSGHFKIGRILTSVVAMTCLRAQQGVMPQLTSHVFGLKKSLLEGGGAEGEEELKGQEWLTSDEGATWILESADEISSIVAEGRTTFAGPPAKAKL